MVVIDPDRAVSQSRCHSLGPTGVLRPHGSGQPVDRVVRHRHCRVLEGVGVVAGEGLDGEHRAKGLIVDARHLAGASVQNRREVVATGGQVGIRRSGATGAQLGAVGDRRLNVGVHLGAVDFADQRPRLGVVVERTPQTYAASSADQLGHHLIVDLVLDDQA